MKINEVANCNFKASPSDFQLNRSKKKNTKKKKSLFVISELKLIKRNEHLLSFKPKRNYV